MVLGKNIREFKLEVFWIKEGGVSGHLIEKKGERVIYLLRFFWFFRLRIVNF